MKVWLVAIAFLICACAGSTDGSDHTHSDVQSAAQRYGDTQSAAERYGGDNPEMLAQLDALEARISYLEGYVEHIVSGALKEQESTGATTKIDITVDENAITMDDLSECIREMVPLINGAFDELVVEHDGSSWGSGHRVLQGNRHTIRSPGPYVRECGG